MSHCTPCLTVPHPTLLSLIFWSPVVLSDFLVASPFFILPYFPFSTLIFFFLPFSPRSKGGAIAPFPPWIHHWICYGFLRGGVGGGQHLCYVTKKSWKVLQNMREKRRACRSFFKKIRGYEYEQKAGRQQRCNASGLLLPRSLVLNKTC